MYTVLLGTSPPDPSHATMDGLALQGQVDYSGLRVGGGMETINHHLKYYRGTQGGIGRRG